MDMWQRRSGARGRRRLRCGVAAALLAALAGACLPLDMSRDRRAAVRLRGKKLMVAPFRMPNAAYFESKIGANLAQMVEGIIRTELPDAKLIALDSVPIELTELADVDKARLSPLRVAKDMGANYVLYGEIHLLRAKDPKAVGILQGTLILSARVVDLDENQVVWRLQPTVKKYYYPPLFAGTEMIPAQETDEEEVIRKVMLTAALELSSVFTGKKPTLEPKSRL